MSCGIVASSFFHAFNWWVKDECLCTVCKHSRKLRRLFQLTSIQMSIIGINEIFPHVISAHKYRQKLFFSPFFFCAHGNLFQFNLAKNRLTHSHHQPISRQLLLGDIRIIFQLRLKQHKDRIKSFWWCYHQRLSPPKLVCHCLRSPFPSLSPSVSAGAET